MTPKTRPTYAAILPVKKIKIKERINEISNNFLVLFEKNYGAAAQAFEDRPLIGTCIGAFYGTYSKHEVHSTYLKLLGETGILGTIGYLLFIISFLILFRIKSYKKNNPYSDYLATMFPFLLGCFISWSYTYHLRKREFWILVSLILIVNYCARQYQLNGEIKRPDLTE